MVDFSVFLSTNGRHLHIMIVRNALFQVNVGGQFPAYPWQANGPRLSLAESRMFHGQIRHKADPSLQIARHRTTAVIKSHAHAQTGVTGGNA
jgi:hypothetical protein